MFRCGRAAIMPQRRTAIAPQSAHRGNRPLLVSGRMRSKLKSHVRASRENRLSALFRATAPRSEWLLDPEYIFLNHGSYGATPRVVLAEQDRWRERMECHPNNFMNIELPVALRSAAASLASFLTCNEKDLVFIENATVGCNAVLNSLRLTAGDEILLTDHGYPAVRNAAEHVAMKTGAKSRRGEGSVPDRQRKIILDAVASHLGSRTRIVILDHITSSTAIHLSSPGIGLLVSTCRRICSHRRRARAGDAAARYSDDWCGLVRRRIAIMADGAEGSAFLWTHFKQQADTHPLWIFHTATGRDTRPIRLDRYPRSERMAVRTGGDGFCARIGGASLRERNIQLARQSPRNSRGCGARKWAPYADDLSRKVDGDCPSSAWRSDDEQRSLEDPAIGCSIPIGLRRRLIYLPAPCGRQLSAGVQ